VFTVGETAEMAATYRAAADQAGRPSSLIVLRDLWVDDTDEKARATFAPIIEPVFRYYFKRGGLSHDASLTPETVTLDRALSERVICGSPDTVAAQIADLLRRTGADGCAFMTRQPHGPSHEETCRAVQRLGTEVLPKVRKLIG
jgi:alkanesulfonate monooxygenase SsuD/methylene tetrahydromethanopterin reductase-like flavin-dependent oxidoreductase (luciferase family)